MTRLAAAMGFLVFFMGLAMIPRETYAAVEETQKVTAQSQSAVFSIEIGTSKGTGFLISRDPPILATVAHLASKAKEPAEILVRANETGAVKRIRAIHIHKGFKSDQGGKNPYSADLALLELDGSADGLGSPLPLAAPKTDADLRGMSILSLGFPFYATQGEELTSPEAVARRGIISRMTDYDSTTTSPLAKRPMVEHSLDNLNGESGAPVLIEATGEVIAIHHGTRRMKKKGTEEVLGTYCVAIRVEELWALLDQAGHTKAVRKDGK